MKALFLSVLVAAVTVFVCAADNPSISGKWKVHSSIAGNENDANCTFNQKDSDLTGSCTGDSGELKLTGKVDGSKVTFSYDSEYQGTALTVKYSGTLDSAATKIAGTVTVDPFGVDGDFTATQTK